MENVPSEIKWQIVKFLRHPMAEAFTNAEQVKEAMELANYNIDYNYWDDEQEQERWRVVFFSENFILTMESITRIDGNTSWG